MNEYVEKTSPMKFSPIEKVPPMSPPMNFREEPSDELRGEGPSDEMSPPMNIGDKPSDQLRGEEPSDESPSDEDVRAAILDLVDLTQCRCGDPWTSRGLHERECLEHYRPDVTLVARMAGYLVAHGPEGYRVVRVTRNA